jgi:cell division protein FtsL
MTVVAFIAVMLLIALVGAVMEVSDELRHKRHLVQENRDQLDTCIDSATRAYRRPKVESSGDEFARRLETARERARGIMPSRGKL